MKLLYVILLAVGVVTSLVGSVLWAKAGFPFRAGELSTLLAGTKPWHLEKDSYLIFVVFGLALAGYSAIELHLKRWEK